MALLVTECQELHKKGPFFTRPLLSLTFLSSPNYANKGSISVVKGRIEADRKANEKVAIKGKEEKRTTKVSMAFCRIKGHHQKERGRINCNSEGWNFVLFCADDGSNPSLAFFK